MDQSRKHNRNEHSFIQFTTLTIFQNTNENHLCLLNNTCAASITSTCTQMEIELLQKWA